MTHSPDENDTARTTLSTHELLRLYAGGDGSAERQLFGDHRAHVVEYIHKHRWSSGLRAYTTAEDLADEVFVRAFASRLLSNWKDPKPGSLRKALFHIANCVIVDTYRRQGAQRRSMVSGPAVSRMADETTADLFSFVESPDPSPTSNARSAEMVEVGRRVLTDSEWDIFRLLKLEGVTPTAVAAQVGRTPAAVRGLWHRARKKLILALAKGEWDATSGPRP